MRPVLLLCCLTLGPAALAQEGGQPPPVPAPAPAPLPPAQARAKNLEALRDTRVHFDFRRAPVDEIMIALARASGVRVRVGRSAMQTLARRRFRMKYVADRRGDQVLTDVAKAAALDFIVTGEGAFLDLPKKIRKLRKKLGLPGKPLRLSAKDVKRMLKTKQLSLAVRKQPLKEVLGFLRKETGVRFVLAPKEAEQLAVTLKVTATPLGQLLDQLTAPLGLDWIRQGSVILIDQAKSIAKQKKAGE